MDSDQASSDQPAGPATADQPAPKTALVVFRKRAYRISPTALQSMMELTRKSIDRDLAIGFVLRQEGYDIWPEAAAPTLTL